MPLPRKQPAPQATVNSSAQRGGFQPRGAPPVRPGGNLYAPPPGNNTYTGPSNNNPYTQPSINTPYRPPGPNPVRPPGSGAGYTNYNDPNAAHHDRSPSGGSHPGYDSSSKGNFVPAQINPPPRPRPSGVSVEYSRPPYTPFVPEPSNDIRPTYSNTPIPRHPAPGPRHVPPPNVVRPPLGIISF